MLQAEKLFNIEAQFQSELEKIAGEANYPDEKDKDTMKKTVRNRQIAFNVSRLAFGQLQRERSRAALVQYVRIACGEMTFGDCQVLSPPLFSKYEVGRFGSDGKWQDSKWLPYGNTSRLESMQDEFNVLLISSSKKSAKSVRVL